MVIPLHDDNPTHRLPVVTLLLIAVNVFVYFFVQPHGGGEGAEFDLEHAAIPCELRQGEPLTISEIVTQQCDRDGGLEGELEIEGVPDSEAVEAATEGAEGQRPFFPDKNVWLAVLVSMFLHGSLLHLAGNMLFLWVFGNNVEDHLGPIIYVIFYAVTGAAAMGAHVLGNVDSTVPVIGASGAIAGVMGAYLVLWPRARVLTLVPLLLFFVIYLPAGLVLGLWFALQFLTNPNEGIAWLAHVGGFVAGAALAFGLRAVLGPPRPRPGRARPDSGFGDFRRGYEGRY